MSQPLSRQSWPHRERPVANGSCGFSTNEGPHYHMKHAQSETLDLERHFLLVLVKYRFCDITQIRN